MLNGPVLLPLSRTQPSPFCVVLGSHSLPLVPLVLEQLPQSDHHLARCSSAAPCRPSVRCHRPAQADPQVDPRTVRRQNRPPSSRPCPQEWASRSPQQSQQPLEGRRCQVLSEGHLGRGQDPALRDCRGEVMGMDRGARLLVRRLPHAWGPAKVNRGTSKHPTPPRHACRSRLYRRPGEAHPASAD